MPKRTLAILLVITLLAAFVMGLLIEPSQSQANPGTGWMAEYFNNTDLSGTPVITQVDDQINFNWGTSAPLAGINEDEFSVRWTANPNFAQAGLYRFRVGADDGIRVYVDNQLIVNEFILGEFRVFTRDVQLSAGVHNLRVEYFESMDLAGVLVQWSLVTASTDASIASPVPTATVPTATPTPGGRVDALGRPLGHVATGTLNVRANPSINAARITQIYLYRSYPILGISGDGAWYLIELRDGRQGWVAERYIYRTESLPVPIVAAETGNQSTLPNVEVAGVTTSELKIRVFPRTGEQIGIVPRDALVRVLARNSSGSWFFISWQGIEGWVFSPYVVLTNGRVIDLIIR